VVGVCSLGRFAPVGGTVTQCVTDVDLLDHEDLVLDIDLTFGL
jgi:hypothetical protein